MNEQSYSNSERRIANAINSFPRIKRIAKRVYQVLNYSMHRKPYKYKSSYSLETVPVRGETFFGYYDKSPITRDNKFILFHESDNLTKQLPSAVKSIFIGVLDVDTNQIIYKKEVTAYNWQQGCRLQWLNDRKFIFNNFNKKLGYHSITVYLSPNGKIEEEIVPLPIYDCFGEDFALSLNFARLNQLRPDYGYRNDPISQKIDKIDDDGITLIDLKSKSSSFLISLEDILKVESNSRILESKQHKVNHIMIAPSGNRFMFLHRYFIGGRRYDRLMLYDFELKQLEVLASDDMVSHCCWLDEFNIIGFLRDSSLGDKYYKIDIRSKEKIIIGEGVIDRFGDGHPSTFQNLMMFDTYPDKARMKRLFIYDLITNDLIELGEFYESLKYREQTRCDLHPRFSLDGKRIFFDSVHEGKRQLFWFKRI